MSEHPHTCGVDPQSVKGFLAPEEGERLYELMAQAARVGPGLEVGSYCGKSTLWLGCACVQQDTTLFAVDHHLGSEEHQLGEEYHDPDLYDAKRERMDSFPAFRDTLIRAGLTDTVVPLVTSSAAAAKNWTTRLGLVFIDGGHSLEAARTDYECWAKYIGAGGILAIHDIFLDPAEGGQAPRTIYEAALKSELFTPLEMTGTLGVLQRVS